MFLLDDILLAPLTGLMRIFREIHAAAEQELADEAEGLTEKLSELYMMLETGRMEEAEFDAAEKEILDRLDQLQAQESHLRGGGGEEGGEGEDGEDGEEDEDEEDEDEEDEEEEDEEEDLEGDDEAEDEG